MSSLDEALESLGGDLSEALEELPVPAVVLDVDGVVRWQNVAHRERKGDITGRRFAELVGDDDLARYNELLKRILCDGEPAEFTLTVRNPEDGDIERIEVSSSPIRDGGSVVGVFGLGRPVPGVTQPNSQRAHADAETSLLTERQLEVLHLLAEGRSTQQIATALSLSPTTVRNYVARILAALDVHTRLQAVVVARRRGLL